MTSTTFRNSTRLLAALTIALLSCTAPHVGYLVIPATPVSDQEPAEEPMRIAIMDTVADAFEVQESTGRFARISEFRKSVGDALFLTYRGNYPRAQITQIPLDKGFELLVWGAQPQTGGSATLIAWRAEFLKDGKLLGEISADIPAEANPDFEAALVSALAAAVKRTFREHMLALKAEAKASAPQKKFLSRGKVFSVQENSLVVSSRMDFPPRSGQVFDVVDAKNKVTGRLRVGAVYHTNFKAELLQGRAIKGAEVGSFVR